MFRLNSYSTFSSLVFTVRMVIRRVDLFHFFYFFSHWQTLSKQFNVYMNHMHIHIQHQIRTSFTYLFFWRFHTSHSKTLGFFCAKLKIAFSQCCMGNIQNTKYRFVCTSLYKIFQCIIMYYIYIHRKHRLMNLALNEKFANANCSN